MKTLALEFSSSRRSVAVWAEGDVRGVAETLQGKATPALQLVEAALRQADVNRLEIERIAVGLGPGSYTGIRMALALAQGLSVARQPEGIGLSSVDATAAAACREGFVGTFDVAVDAQRGECYLAGFESSNAGYVQRDELRIVPAEVIRQLIDEGHTVIGPDLEKVLPGVRSMWPQAADLARLASMSGEGHPIETLIPIYLRPVAFVKAPGR